MLIKGSKELIQKEFSNEKELQLYFETHLKEILNYDFVASEFSVGDFRIDTLAFDKELNAFRIIEFKNIRNHSLMDQGFTYLKALLENKAEFVLKYNAVFGVNLQKTDFDWSQTRVIFVSPTYTAYQRNATDFQNIPIDLVLVTRYDDDLVEVDFIKKTSKLKTEELEVFQDSFSAQELKVFTEDDHFLGYPSFLRELYEYLKERILEIGNIDIVIGKTYISFKGRRNICDVIVYKNKLKLLLNMKKGTLIDTYNNTMDVSSKGHLGMGDYQAEIRKEEDIDFLMPLVLQSWEVNKK